MPELPEVETIRRYLREGGRDYPAILGMRVSAATLYWAKSLADPEAETFPRRITGQSVQEVGRRGKFLLLSLQPDTLLIHLRMSGDLRVEPVASAVQTHDRMALDFDTGWRLAFNDPRKFGRLWLVDDPQRVLAGLGPEPLNDSFTPQWLADALRIRRRQLKPLLLDQGFIAGLGNIYADEALHMARLHPLTVSNSVTAEQAQALHQAIHSVLNEGIRRNGASFDWVYRGGEFQNYFRVYAREDEECPVCGTRIVRILAGQRSTHFCPRCQVPQ